MAKMIPCESCGFSSCKNRVKCAKEARLDIDASIRALVYDRLPGPDGHHVLNTYEHGDSPSEPQTDFTWTAAKLLRGWIKEAMQRTTPAERAVARKLR